MNRKYNYFSNLLIKNTIYERVKAGAEHAKLDEDTQKLLDELVSKFKESNYEESPVSVSSNFVELHKGRFQDLIKKKGINLKYFLTFYIGFSCRWGSSSASFGKNSEKRASRITEKELRAEMTNPNGSIKKLLDSAEGNLSVVKNFLPAIMISLDTNTRNKLLMEFKHTGRFCFDFDKLDNLEQAIEWMNTIWKGTPNIKPYLAFISPRKKGFKIFCEVDTSCPEFQRDFQLEQKEVLEKHHKVWYEGARIEIENYFPFVKGKIDTSTNDPQRLTYLPFISDPLKELKYSENRLSNYTSIVNNERERKKKIFKKKLSKNSKEIAKIMRNQGIGSKEDAYHMLVKDRSSDFDLELEVDKFIKVVDFLENLTNNNTGVYNWVSEKFNDYPTLRKLSWVLYGVFGDLGIAQLKRLIPSGSNKLDENHGDYRWTMRSKDDYTDEQLQSLTPGAFYKLVMYIGEVKDFISKQYNVASRYVKDFKILNDYYETYIRNADLLEDQESDERAELKEFLNEITLYLDKKKIRLPLITDLDQLTAEVKLGPSEYLDKDFMKDLFQNKYKDKRVFSFRGPCGIGKNTLAANPKLKIPGRIMLGEPFKSITDQIAFEAWSEGNRNNQLFVNSTIDETVEGFKENDSDVIGLNYSKTLRGFEIPSTSELVIHCTYNQILNTSHEDLATFDYVFIDEAHSITEGLEYRPKIVAKLIYYISEFIAKKPNGKAKIIFMTGTPNVETLIMLKIMEEQNTSSLFQRIKVDKEYKVKPTMHLTHLDTERKNERQDAVIDQINTYLKEGRKVCHIFNYKDKMDEYMRTIQSKLSRNIKIGFFYSGSAGECTNNILSGKFGEYDVVLTTSYFINGININKDGLTDQEFLKGKTSTQAYGLVIDLGIDYTKVSALAAVQAVNRFRNRKCHSTVFLPKIFNSDLKNTSIKFDFNNTGKVVLGINKYNHHLLSDEEDLEANGFNDRKSKEKILLLKSIRKNPIFISLHDISKSSREEHETDRIIDLLIKENLLYNDWFFSLDGYHYMAKDAGFLSVIKHKSTVSSLIEVTEDQVKLENAVIENFLNDHSGLKYLSNKLDVNKRIYVKATDNVLDPFSTSIGNLKIIKSLSTKCTIEGDFHASHERMVNKLIGHYIQLCYWYGADKTLEILSLIIIPKAYLVAFENESYLKKITAYVNSCQAIRSDKLYFSLSYIRGLDILSSIDLGVKKIIGKTFVSYVIADKDLADNIKQAWTEHQYNMTLYRINRTSSKSNKELSNYFSNKELVRYHNLERLEKSLSYIGEYKPYSYSKRGNLKNLETIKIPRVIGSEKLLELKSRIEVDEVIPPKTLTLEFFLKSMNTTTSAIISDVSPILDEASLASPFGTDLKEKLLAKLKDNQFVSISSFLENYNKSKIKEISKPTGLEPFIKKMTACIPNFKNRYIDSFMVSEFMNYKDLKSHGNIPFVKKLLCCDEDLNLESLHQKFTSSPTIPSKSKIYTSLKKSSKIYLNKKRKPTTNSAISYLVFDQKGALIYAHFYLISALRFLCDYAFRNESFTLKDGSIPIETENKGIYNAETFKLEYYLKNSHDKTVANYFIEEYDVDILDYRKHIF